ncbi:hypothetical protein RINTHM_5580 [Richelia intracellularis HM01]|nr:hypothetical protein RINTHM_5580 [Richelia intracellularis HM01]
MHKDILTSKSAYAQTSLSRAAETSKTFEELLASKHAYPA